MTDRQITSLPHPPIAILGVPFDNLTTAETLNLVTRMVESRRPHHLMTVTVDLLVQAQSDVELRRILFDAHLVLCDGTPLQWASRRLGNPLPERVAGKDLAPLLMNIAEAKGYRLFLLGDTRAVGPEAVATLAKKFPRLNVVSTHSPASGQLLEIDHDEIHRHIVATRPDVLLVAFDCPFQEKWIALHHRSLGVPVSIGIGNTQDCFAANHPRQPRRLVRAAKTYGSFALGLMHQWWQLQFRSRKITQRPVSIPVQSEVTWQCIKLPEFLDLAAVRDDVLLVDQMLADGRHCFLDASGIRFVDSTGIGLLIGVQKKVRATGRQVVLLAPSPALLQALQLMKLDQFFGTAPDLASARQLLELREREQLNVVTPRTVTSAHPLRWSGEITAANAEQVWEQTRAQLLARPAHSEFVIDLGGLRFIDSTGVGVMVRTRKTAQQGSVGLHFVGIQSEVLNVIQLARLEEFLLR